MMDNMNMTDLLRPVPANAGMDATKGVVRKI